MIPSAGTMIGDITIKTVAEQPSKTYKMDYGKNQIVGYVDGAEAVAQAIYKILLTERFKHLIYSWNYGVELEALIGKSYSVYESELQRIVKEAVLQDKRINTISNFMMTQSGRNAVSIAFTAETIFGDIPIETEVERNV